MTDTPVLGLTQLESGQDGVELYNRNLRVLEALANRVFYDQRTAGTSTTAPGRVYNIDGVGTGSFAGHDDEIAVVIDGTDLSTADLHFMTPEEGWRFYVLNENKIIYFTGSTWSDLDTGL